MRILNPLLIGITLLSLTACNGIERIKADKVPMESAFLVLDTDMTFDGEAHSNCRLGTSAVNENLSIGAYDVDSKLAIIKLAKGGLTNIDAIQCTDMRFLWNKVRRKNLLSPLIVNAEPGTITYPGTVMGDWDSEGMALKDLINGGGSLTEDEGTLVLKREDRTPEIKKILETKNPQWLERFTFVTTKFEKESDIIQ